MPRSYGDSITPTERRFMARLEAASLARDEQIVDDARTFGQHEQPCACDACSRHIARFGWWPR